MLGVFSHVCLYRARCFRHRIYLLTFYKCQSAFRFVGFIRSRTNFFLNCFWFVSANCVCWGDPNCWLIASGRQIASNIPRLLRRHSYSWVQKCHKKPFSCCTIETGVACCNIADNQTDACVASAARKRAHNTGTGTPKYKTKYMHKQDMDCRQSTTSSRLLILVYYPRVRVLRFLIRIRQFEIENWSETGAARFNLHNCMSCWCYRLLCLDDSVCSASECQVVIELVGIWKTLYIELFDDVAN